MFNFVIKDLGDKFSIKDLCVLHFFLGVEVTHSKSLGLFLSQRTYTSSLLNCTNMLGSNSLQTPLCSSTSLSLLDDTNLANPTTYCPVVGNLQYLSLSHPDIRFAINKPSQFMHKPTKHHWSVIKWVLLYLNGNMDHGVFLHK